MCDTAAVGPGQDNLPLPLTSFVGRHRELAELPSRLAAGRCLTLVGPGGVGKTRLAIEIARRFGASANSEICYVDIARLGAPEAALASVLGVRDERDAPVLTAIATALGERRVLIVLDTCEHVAAACAALTDSLLDTCTGVAILATSRQPINLTREEVRHVAPLEISGPESEAVLLFADRARLAKPDFNVRPEIEAAVTEICRRVEGLPLSIELAAACARLLTPEQTLARLEDRFRLLRVTGRSSDERHRTLRATIDWSYNLLSPSEQQVFARVSVFAGGFTAAAARSVCSGNGIDDDEVTRLLDRLVASSLAYVDLDGERYRMLDTIAEYARERLVASTEESTWRRAHRDWYLAIAELARNSIYSSSQGAWLEALEADLTNLRAAIAWTIEVDRDARVALRFSCALYRFWDLHGHPVEGRQWTERAIALAGSSEPELVAESRYGLAILAFAQGDYTRTRIEAEACLSLRRVLGDREGIATALNLCSLAADYLNDFEGAIRLQEESLALSRELGLTAAVHQGTYHLGLLALRQGELNQATTHLEASAAGWNLSGNRIGAAGAIINLAEVMRMRGDLASARELTEEALAVARETGTKRLEAACLHARGQVLAAAGDDRGARIAYRESAAICRESDALDGLIEIVESLSLAAARRGDGALARQLVATASADRTRLNVPRDPALQREIDDAIGSASTIETSPWTLDEALKLGLMDPEQEKASTDQHR